MSTGEARSRAWGRFRRRHFPNTRVNLNPGTLGTPSADLDRAGRAFLRGDRAAHPLGQYEAGRAALARVRRAAARLWPLPGYEIAAGGGTTEAANLLTLALPSALPRAGTGRGPLRVLTTPHEHYGGIGGFERHPAYRVHYLSAVELNDLDAFARRAARLRPHVAFFSDVAYDTCRRFPLAEWTRILRRRVPRCLIVVDAAQSLGLLPLPRARADIFLGSAHKWLNGPAGTGFLWIRPPVRKKLGALFWAGQPLLSDPPARFEFTGAMDFSVHARLEAALGLYQKAGPRRALARSRRLGRDFHAGLSDILRKAGLAFETRSGTGLASFSVDFESFDPYPLYQYLDRRGVHVKCIKREDRLLCQRILRFGFPYYESPARLKKALNAIRRFFYNHS